MSCLESGQSRLHSMTSGNYEVSGVGLSPWDAHLRPWRLLVIYKPRLILPQQ